MAAPRFEIRGGSPWYHFVLIARNGEVLATSENFGTKVKVRRSIAAVMGAVHAIDKAITPTVDATKVRD